MEKPKGKEKFCAVTFVDSASVVCLDKILFYGHNSYFWTKHILYM